MTSWDRIGLLALQVILAEFVAPHAVVAVAGLVSPVLHAGLLCALVTVISALAHEARSTVEAETASREPAD